MDEDELCLGNINSYVAWMRLEEEMWIPLSKKNNNVMKNNKEDFGNHSEHTLIGYSSAYCN